MPDLLPIEEELCQGDIIVTHGRKYKVACEEWQDIAPGVVGKVFVMHELRALFYFGCMADNPGHYLYNHHGRVARFIPEVMEVLNLPEDLDGRFCPPESLAKEGEWLLTKTGDWKVIAWWDRSADNRPGSHSTFIFQGFDDDPREMLGAAQIAFPQVFSRQRAVLRPFDVQAHVKGSI